MSKQIQYRIISEQEKDMKEADHLDYLQYWERMCKAHFELVQRRDALQIKLLERPKQSRQMNLGEFSK